jgi:exoribonuclease-2
LPAPYAPQDADVYAIVSAFDAAYTGYADFQARMERYWCLRWLAQEGITQVDGTVVRGDVVRIDGLPLVTRIPGLPDLPRGRRVRFDVLGQDEIELSLELRLREILADAPPQLDPEEEDEAVVAPTEPAPGGADGRAGAPFDDAAAEVEPTTPDPAADSALLDPADPTDATEVADETAGRPVPVGVPSLPRT